MGILAMIAPGSATALVFLAICLVLVLAFEFSNGFHDTANAVATVIDTHALPPVVAVVWSGIVTVLGVTLGGIAVSTTHGVTGGIAGTMVASGVGVEPGMPKQIASPGS